MKALIIFLVLVGFVICDGAEMARRPHRTNSAGLRNPTLVDPRTTAQRNAVRIVDRPTDVFVQAIAKAIVARELSPVPANTQLAAHDSVALRLYVFSRIKPNPRDIVLPSFEL